MQIVVPDDQLSLAIGRRGQNVRLAAQLTGWKIDITSETKVAEEKHVAWASLSRIEGVSDIVVQTLYNHGFRKAADVVDADEEYLAGLPGFSADAVPRIKSAAQAVVKAEAGEKLALRAAAREDARVLLTIERAAHDSRLAGKSDEARLAEVEGVRPYVLERLKEAFYTSPEDLYFEDDVERLVNVAGFSPGKARQLKFAAGETMAVLSKGLAKQNEKPLSEPEQRDAQAYDELNANAGASPAAAAAAAEEA